MSAFLEATTAATVTQLTTTARVKEELGLTENTYDARISSLIDDASDHVVRYIGVREDSRGSTTLGVETLTETFRLEKATDILRLSRFPLRSVTSVSVDGTSVDAADYEAQEETGYLYRLSGGERVSWDCGKTVIVYEAGHRLPSQSERTLPRDIERACISEVRSLWFGSQRNPHLRSEQTVGVKSVQYAVSADGDDGLCADARSLVAKYMRGICQ